MHLRQDPTASAHASVRQSDSWVAAGLVCTALAAYILTGPGRIDVTDGQWRYEVTQSLVDEGLPIVRDPVLVRGSIVGRHGLLYSAYGLAGSAVALPLVWIGKVLFEDADGELRRFLFSLTSAFFGAFLLALLYRFYRALEIDRSPAFRWTLVAGFATLLWPLAASTFDQAQHAFFATASLLLAFRSAQCRSLALAAAGGAVGGLLLSYQEVYAVLIPALAIATLPDSAEARGDSRGRLRFLVFVLASGIGLALFFHYNYARFGDFFLSGKLELPPGHPPVLGNPIIGLWGLLLSPGKSAFLYSPTIVLCLLGLRGLWRRQKRLAQAIVLLSIVHLALISSLSFWAGDWCWGPRYLVLPLALLSLALPFLPKSGLMRTLTLGTVGLGLSVQLLALSLDHQRFFRERQLPAYFWADGPGFYSRESQLFARPLEIVRAVREGVLDEAEQFQPTPYPRLLTYCILGSREALEDANWVRRFQVFHLPRPWPLWMPRVDKSRYRVPVRVAATSASLLLLGVAGGFAIRRGLTGAFRRRSVRGVGS